MGCNGVQNRIASRMAIGIVEELKIVHVHHCESQRCFLSNRAVAFFFKSFLKRTVIQQASQRIMVGPLQCFGQQLLALGFKSLALGYVLDKSLEVEYPVMRIANTSSLLADPECCSVSTINLRLEILDLPIT